MMYCLCCVGHEMVYCWQRKGGEEGSTFKWLLLTSCSNCCSQSPSSCCALEQILLRQGSAFQEDKVIPVSLFEVNNTKPLQPSLAFQEHSMIVTSMHKIKNANHYRQKTIHCQQLKCQISHWRAEPQALRKHLRCCPPVTHFMFPLQTPTEN